MAFTEHVATTTQQATATVSEPAQGILVPLFLSYWYIFLLVGIGLFAYMYFSKQMVMERFDKDIFYKNYDRIFQMCKERGVGAKIVKSRKPFIFLLIGSFVAFIVMISASLENSGSLFYMSIYGFAGVLVIYGILTMSKFLDKPFSVYLQHDNRQRFIGNYAGECITKDGYKNLLLWKTRKWLIYPDYFILKVYINKKVKISSPIKPQKKGKSSMDDAKETKYRLTTYDMPDNLMFEDHDSGVIIIRALDIEKDRYFYTPIFIDRDGNVVDNSIVTYDTEKNISLTDTLYAQTEKYGEQLLKSLDMNLPLGMERKKPRDRAR
ncbi:hypothetical protein GQ472_06130 [archaeon]|nr:hypothetical protein [archaeon]